MFGYMHLLFGYTIIFFLYMLLSFGLTYALLSFRYVRFPLCAHMHSLNALFSFPLLSCIKIEELKFCAIKHRLNKDLTRQPNKDSEQQNSKRITNKFIEMIMPIWMSFLKYWTNVA